MSNYTVTYNGITDKSLGAHAKSRPSVPAPIPKVNVVELAGRDGAYYDAEGTFNDIAIQITFAWSSTTFVWTPTGTKKSAGNWFEKYRAIKNWLLSGDNGNLSFSDQSGYYYRVRNVEIVSTERTARIFGEVTAVFYCDGYTYLNTGDQWTKILTYYTMTRDGVVSYHPRKLSDTLDNSYALCHPIYQITGSGTLQIVVNDKGFNVTVNESATIDTERMLTLNEDSEWVNTTASGDYEDLWLPHGSSSWSVSYSPQVTMGFEIFIKPQWRCL